MVLLTLAEIALQLSWSLTKGLYNGGYWLLYGSPKTKEQLLIEKLEELQNKENSEISSLKKEIKIIRKLLSNNLQLNSPEFSKNLQNFIKMDKKNNKSLHSLDEINWVRKNLKKTHL